MGSKMRKIKNTGFDFNWESQWEQVGAGDNWNVWTPLRFEIEHDVLMGGLEISLYVLCVGVTVRYEWMTAKKVEIAQTVHDIDTGVRKTKTLDATVGGFKIEMPADMELPEGLEIADIVKALEEAVEKDGLAKPKPVKPIKGKGKKDA